MIYAECLEAELKELVARLSPDRLFVLCDENTVRCCWPLLASSFPALSPIVIPASDVAKNLTTLSGVWQALQQGGATRHSLLLNLGGGMVTDLGGFAAATFKRGIRFINVPTTLLSMVDAAVGGKTGVNFGGLKNEIGCFCDADEVAVSTTFLRTLDGENLRSGFAEMLKHALLDGREMWAEHLRFNLAEPDLAVLQQLVRQSIGVKQSIVAQDPHEKGIRKALNLGHTIGHALESHALHTKPILHGYAVAYGLIAELYMSVAEAGFPTDVLRQTANFIRAYYGTPNIGCNDYDTLYAFMQHDKKNSGDHINFTLLSDIGQVQTDCRVSRSLVDEALDFLRDA